MRISYSAIWDDTVRLIRAHASLAIALAGVFLFLPALLIGHFLPIPEVTDPNEVIRVVGEYLRGNILWLLLNALFTAAGTLAILVLILRGPGSSVGTAIGAAVSLVVPYFLAMVLTVLPIAAALGLVSFLLPMVPGLVALLLLILFLVFAVFTLYAVGGRLAPLGALMVAQNERSPASAITRTWALTRGHGWPILGLLVLISVAGFVLMTVISGIIGLVLHLALPEDLAQFISLIVSTAASTALQVTLIFLYAAIYRALAGRPVAEASVPAD